MKSLRRTGFTVASLLLLTAVVAIYAAAIMSARNMGPAPRTEELAGCVIVGFFFGTTAGFFLGLFLRNRNRDMVLTVMVGAAFGPPTVTLLVIPDSLPVLLVGGVVVVGFALVVRFLTPSKDSGRESDDMP